MLIRFLGVKPVKKLDIKKPSLKKQLLWFLGLYSVSLIAIGIFHEFSKWLINALK